MTTIFQHATEACTLVVTRDDAGALIVIATGPGGTAAMQLDDALEEQLLDALLGSKLDQLGQAKAKAA